MCQGCVDQGRMTAEELATATAAGDITVIPLMNLSPKDFSKSLAAVTVSAMLSGMEPGAAVAAAVLVAKEYARTRDLSADDLTKVIEDLDKV